MYNHTLPLISYILFADRFVIFPSQQKFLLSSALIRDDGVVLQHHRLKYFWCIPFHLRGCMCDQLAVVIPDSTYLYYYYLFYFFYG